MKESEASHLVGEKGNGWVGGLEGQGWDRTTSSGSTAALSSIHGHTSYLFICLLGVNMTIIGSKELSCKTNFCAGSQKRVDDDQRQVGTLGKQIL